MGSESLASASRANSSERALLWGGWVILCFCTGCGSWSEVKHLTAVCSSQSVFRPHIELTPRPHGQRVCCLHRAPVKSVKPRLVWGEHVKSFHALHLQRLPAAAIVLSLDTLASPGEERLNSR